MKFVIVGLEESLTMSLVVGCTESEFVQARKHAHDVLCHTPNINSMVLIHTVDNGISPQTITLQSMTQLVHILAQLLSNISDGKSAFTMLDIAPDTELPN